MYIYIYIIPKSLRLSLPPYLCLFVLISAAFLRLLESEQLTTTRAICAVVASTRLDELQWSRLPLGGPGGPPGGPRGCRRVNELLVKERTKRKFTLTVHNAARENIALYAKMHALLLHFALHPVC